MQRVDGTLNTVDAISLTIGSMVGAGIFSVLALTVQTAGPAAVISWALIVLLSLPLVFTFSDLALVLGESGGPYVYIRDHASERLGLWTAYLFLVSAAGAAEALFIAFVHMMSELGIPMAFLWAVLVLGVLAGVASFGIRMGAGMQRILTVGTVLLLVLCIVIGLLHPSQFPGVEFRGDSLSSNAFPNGWIAILPATFYAFWTYSGWEAVSVPSGSYKSRASLARGMMIGSFVVGILYIFVAFAAVVSVPADDLARYSNPLVLVGKLLSPAVATLIGFGSLVVVTGSLMSWLIATASLWQAMVRDGVLPASKRVRNYQGAYHPAIPWWIAGGLSLLALLPIFGPAVAASSLTALIGYGVVFFVVFADKRAARGFLRTATARRILALLSLLVVLVLIFFSGWKNLWPTLVICLFGAILFIRRKRT